MFLGKKRLTSKKCWRYTEFSRMDNELASLTHKAHASRVINITSNICYSRKLKFFTIFSLAMVTMKTRQFKGNSWSMLAQKSLDWTVINVWNLKKLFILGRGMFITNKILKLLNGWAVHEIFNAAYKITSIREKRV